jgi:hypothetical protein
MYHLWVVIFCHQTWNAVRTQAFENSPSIGCSGYAYLLTNNCCGCHPCLLFSVSLRQPCVLFYGCNPIGHCRHCPGPPEHVQSSLNDNVT